MSGNGASCAGAGLGLPAGDAAVGEENVSGGPFLLGDLRRGAAHLALGAGLAVAGASELEIAPDRGAATYVELGPVTPALELSATLSDDADVAMATRVFLNLAEAWQLGASGIVGLTDAAPDFGGSMVLTYAAAFASESADLP